MFGSFYIFKVNLQCLKFFYAQEYVGKLIASLYVSRVVSSGEGQFLLDFLCKEKNFIFQ